MSEITSVSSAAIIAKVFNDFNPPDNDWTSRAFQWIGEALGKMKINLSYARCSMDKEISSYRTKIPCNVEAIIGIEYNCCRLPYKGALKLYQDNSADVCQMQTYVGAHYTLNPGVLHTSFESGTITIHYMGLPVDCHGFPYVPDDEYVKEALAHYIMLKYMQRGGTHPVVSYQSLRQDWELLLERARNSVKMPSVERAWDMMDSWVTIVPTITRQKDFFLDTKFDDGNSANGNINEFRSPSLNAD